MSISGDLDLGLVKRYGISYKEEWQLSVKFHGSRISGDLDLGLVTKIR
jgi:hypothetical protein